MDIEFNEKGRKMINEDYEISPSTMAIVPHPYGSRLYSKIYEYDREFISPLKPMDIIKKSCRFFGVSYEGRKEGTKELLGFSHKLPIAVEPTNSIYFFPTSSPTKSHCIWISLEHVKKVQRVDRNQSMIIFQNDKTITIPVSTSSFNNQLYRTSMLRTKLAQRIAETERKAFYMLHKPNYSKE
ncbi:competence protein ComK [Bacillus massilinigeriensis]|uniref:competence protein ComK n=1 Tax=Bacillus massilionigeriensis TaxID=1805475 RepID=UPI00096B46CE|nr:competence protein ComK [Bacillus massilionigeriensis]